jgi:DNA-binding MarR family transcriptional regulator
LTIALEFILTTLTLFFITVSASVLFYRRIKLAQSEYDDSKTLIRSITYGFTKEAKRLEKNIHLIEIEVKEVKMIANQALSNDVDNKITLNDLEVIKVLDDRVNNMEESLGQMKRELQKVANQPKTIISRKDVEAPIQVKSESILQRITDTELEVLTMIKEMGEGTVPQIRENIGKTREHTARLLKKLYDNGFIDRNTSGMPYRYSIRKEIKDLIQDSKKSKSSIHSF